MDMLWCLGRVNDSKYNAKFSNFSLCFQNSKRYIRGQLFINLGTGVG